MQYKKTSLVKKAASLGLTLSLGLPAYQALAQTETQADEAATAEQEKGTILERAHALEQRVHRLLDEAEQHIKDKGITGVNDFNRNERFTDKDLYVFALSEDGVLLASGGWSMILIGENVLGFTDEDERPFFKKIIKQAKDEDSGKVEYLWFNPADGDNDPKITHFRVVDNVIIASGYFPGFSTDEQAKELLDQAVSEYFKDPELALRKFKNRQSGFRSPDQYVFVLDKANRTITWSPNTPESLMGKTLDEIKDIQGKVFLAHIVDTADPSLIQQADYWWFSPISQRVELRRAFYQQVGDSVIAVGTYVLPTD